jgi:hypothetical protein
MVLPIVAKMELRNSCYVIMPEPEATSALLQLLRTVSQFATPTLEYHNSCTKEVMNLKSLQEEDMGLPE